jgi:hypothetical protein
VTVAQHLPLGKGLIGIGANGLYLKQTTGADNIFVSIRSAIAAWHPNFR